MRRQHCTFVVLTDDVHLSIPSSGYQLTIPSFLLLHDGRSSPWYGLEHSRTALEAFEHVGVLSGPCRADLIMAVPFGVEYLARVWSEKFRVEVVRARNG